MKYKIDFTTLLLSALLPFGAISGEPTQPPPTGTLPKDAATAPAGKDEVPPLFKELDRNRDGYVTKDESKRSADVMARFNDLDADHDGKIAAVEFKKGMQGK